MEHEGRIKKVENLWDRSKPANRTVNQQYTFLSVMQGMLLYPDSKCYGSIYCLLWRTGCSAHQSGRKTCWWCNISLQILISPISPILPWLTLKTVKYALFCLPLLLQKHMVQANASKKVSFFAGFTAKIVSITTEITLFERKESIQKHNRPRLQLAESNRLDAFACTLTLVNVLLHDFVVEKLHRVFDRRSSTNNDNHLFILLS